jgi:hypothetical protein
LRLFKHILNTNNDENQLEDLAYNFNEDEIIGLNLTYYVKYI